MRGGIISDRKKVQPMPIPNAWVIKAITVDATV
jgi:hypothetical protein